MILSDKKIKELIGTDQLVESHDMERVRYCGYELRLGKVFLPKSGEVQWDEGVVATSAKTGLQKMTQWIIEPSEILLLETKENVKIPANLCATYSQLNRLARQGLMLVNPSIVEPGYHGPLSCFLVNFSSQRIPVYPNQPIAKIYFHRLEGTPETLQGTVEREHYEQDLATIATKVPKSFLDIAGVEERVQENLKPYIRKSITFAGIFIAVLLLWSQLEPLLSNFIWKRTGLMSASKQAELEIKRIDLEAQRKILGLEGDRKELLERLTKLEAILLAERKKGGN